MTPRLLILLLIAAFLLTLFLVTDRAFDTDDTTPVKTVGLHEWGHNSPSLNESLLTTTTAARARSATRQVHTASVGRPAIAETESSVRGFPCGDDLPPCYVLRRESMMATDPPRVWNGNCYMPVGSLGQCGRSTASGLWQVLRSTWKRFGGYVNAADAPVEVQNDFARQLWRNGAGCSHWSAC